MGADLVVAQPASKPGPLLLLLRDPCLSVELHHFCPGGAGAVLGAWLLFRLPARLFFLDLVALGRFANMFVAQRVLCVTTFAMFDHFSNVIHRVLHVFNMSASKVNLCVDYVGVFDVCVTFFAKNPWRARVFCVVC